MLAFVAAAAAAAPPPPPPPPPPSHDVPTRYMDMSYRLVGTGHHRTLQYRICQRDILAAAQCGKLDQVVLLQTLPRELFFDPYQLDDLARHTGDFTVQLFGRMELELPASVAAPVSAAVTLDVRAWRPDAATLRVSHESRSAGRLMGLQVVSLPVHARYPSPQGSRTATGAWGLMEWALSAEVSVRVDQPALLVKCAWEAKGATVGLLVGLNLSAHVASAPVGAVAGSSGGGGEGGTGAAGAAGWRLLRVSHNACGGSGSGSSSGSGAGDARSALPSCLSTDGRPVGGGGPARPMVWVLAAGVLSHEAVVGWATIGALLAAALMMGDAALVHGLRAGLEARS
ncbi:hypothetical protein FOA52_016053 [Chlamydomonas sp. UWO 241]|nr:hypothetical protein FOA52_016053 [Chlamydomonas sp. UWO 241]